MGASQGREQLGLPALTETVAVRRLDTLLRDSIDLRVFDAAPQPLDDYVVAPGALAVHADGNTVVGKHTGEGLAGELQTLIGVDDVGLAVTGDRVLERPGGANVPLSDQRPNWTNLQWLFAPAGHWHWPDTARSIIHKW